MQAKKSENTCILKEILYFYKIGLGVKQLLFENCRFS